MHFSFARDGALLVSALVLMSVTSASAQQSDGMGTMQGMTMESMGKPASTASTKAGDLEISGGYVKAMLPGQPVGGGYLTIHNGGGHADRLVSVSSPAAARVELHEMTMKDNIMRMRELKDGIPVPAGATVALSPNGLHVMFKKVETPFKEGGSVAVTLTFEKAGAVALTLPVASASGH